jgi:hypothetical protein
MEYIGGSSVDRNSAGVSGRISLLLADVKLFGFEGPVGGILNIRHGISLLLHSSYFFPAHLNRGMEFPGFALSGTFGSGSAARRSVDIGISWPGPPFVSVALTYQINGQLSNTKDQCGDID